MKKYILSLSLFAFTATIIPTSVMAAIDIVEMAAGEVSIDYSGRTIHVENAQGEVLRVYDVTGVSVMTIKIQSSSQKVELGNLPKGCYIVKVGNVVRKISVK